MNVDVDMILGRYIRLLLLVGGNFLLRTLCDSIKRWCDDDTDLCLVMLTGINGDNARCLHSMYV